MKKLIIFGIILSTNLWSQEVTDCMSAFNHFGDGSGNDQIASECIEEVKSAVDDLRIEFKDASRDLVFYGHKNAIIMQDNLLAKSFIIAGNSTLLSDVEKLFYDQEKNELYVYDNGAEAIYVFNTLIPGNVAPYRVLKNDETQALLDFNVKGEEIYILTTRKELVSFLKVANSFARMGYRQDQAQARSIASEEAKTLVIENDEVLAK